MQIQDFTVLIFLDSMRSFSKLQILQYLYKLLHTRKIPSQSNHVSYKKKVCWDGSRKNLMSCFSIRGKNTNFMGIYAKIEKDRERDDLDNRKKKKKQKIGPR